MENDHTAVIRNFHGLVSELAKLLGRYRLGQYLACDKRTLTHWLDEKARPQDARHVAKVIRIALQHGVDVTPYQTFAPIYDFSQGLTFEQQADIGPPNLSWLTAIELPPRARLAKFCGVEAECPLGVSSSPILNDERWADLILDLGYGVSTLKTRRMREKKAYDPPLVGFARSAPDISTYDPSNPPAVEVSLQRELNGQPIPDLVNSIGVPSETHGRWEEIYERIKRHRFGHTIGISILGDGECKADVLRTFDELASRVGSLAPPFVEINVSCPNLEKKPGDIFREPSFILEACRRVRQAISDSSIAIVVKLPWLDEADFRALVPKVASHAQGLAFKNTIRVRAVRRDRDGNLQQAFPGVGREFGGLSGPSTRNLTRRGIKSLAKIKQEGRYDDDIMAIGGLCDVSDVVELLNLGANAVQACTAPMFDPLFAWKVRYHLAHVKNNLSDASTEEKQTLPRDHTELRTYVNFQNALNALKRRSPTIRIPDHVVMNSWNTWMQERDTMPPQAEGYRRLTRREMSMEQWTIILTSKKK